MSGIIQKRFFVEGADVKAGDVLYQIDPATYQANLDSAKANLARAEANVAPARLKMQRFKDLVNISAVSKQEFEDAEAAYKQAPTWASTRPPWKTRASVWPIPK